MPTSRKHLSTGLSRRSCWKGLACVGLAVMLAGCASTNAARNVWMNIDLERTLPPDEPFDLRCGHFMGIVWLDAGPPNPQDDSGDYANMIQDEPLLDLNFDGFSAVLTAQGKKRSDWAASWWPSAEYSNEPPERIYFLASEGDGQLVLELNTDYKGFAPLFHLTFRFGGEIGKFGTVQTISEDFNCMRTSDLEMRTSQ